MRRRKRIVSLLLAAAFFSGASAFAQGHIPAPTPTPPPAEAPYDPQMARLAEILGALAYLRPLCGITGENWRGDMQAILEADTAGEAARRAKLTAAFNRGYRSFSAIHATCSASVQAVERRHRAEAATLVAEITSRFGN